MKRKFDFFEWLVVKDEPIIELATFIHKSKHFWGLGDWRARRQGLRMLEEMKVNGSDLMVILNAPSIKKQPLERIKGMDCVFANQGFKLPQYRELHPKFHVFIDTKLLNGVWDIHWIDEILAMVPDITFVMPVSWAKHPLLQPYINKNIKILWWNAPSSRMSHGVSGFIFQLAWAIGYKRIFFTGYEQTATPSYILHQASHFYGNDPDFETHDTHYIIKDLSMNARHLAAALRSSAHAKKIGVEMYNLTDGGIMDMFERKNFEDVFPSK